MADIRVCFPELEKYRKGEEINKAEGSH